MKINIESFQPERNKVDNNFCIFRKLLFRNNSGIFKKCYDIQVWHSHAVVYDTIKQQFVIKKCKTRVGTFLWNDSRDKNQLLLKCCTNIYFLEITRVWCVAVWPHAASNRILQPLDVKLKLYLLFCWDL